MKIKSILAATATTAMLMTGMNAYALSPTPKGYIVKYDVDHNGVVNAVDASIVLTDYANTSTGKASAFNTTEKWLADFNYDEVVNAVDASSILGYYAHASIQTDEPLEEVFVKYYVEVRFNNDCPAMPEFPTFEECLEWIEQDKATRPRVFADYLRYIVHVQERHLNVMPREFEFGIYVDEVQ